MIAGDGDGLATREGVHRKADEIALENIVGDRHPFGGLAAIDVNARVPAGHDVVGDDKAVGAAGRHDAARLIAVDHPVAEEDAVRDEDVRGLNEDTGRIAAGGAGLGAVENAHSIDDDADAGTADLEQS